jgi:hypothetical protein
VISARRAALLGLTTPLTAIMIALLGLWPEQEDEAVVDVPSPVYGSGGRGVAVQARSLSDYIPTEDNPLQVRNNNKAVIAAIVALIASGVL